MLQLIEKIEHFYRDFQPDKMDLLNEIYSDTVYFQDPITHLTGVDRLKEHFAHTCSGLNYVRFRFRDVITQGSKIVLVWKMEYSHPNLRAGRELVLEGVSIIGCEENQDGQLRISYHRDFYDISEMVYQHVPILRNVLRFLKRGLHASNGDNLVEKGA